MNKLTGKLVGSILILTFLLSSCQKEIGLDPNEPNEVFQNPIIIDLDSIVAERIDLSNLKKIPFERNAQLRDQTSILVGTFALNVFTSLDFYFPKEDINPEMKYTSRVTPVSGNPNLSARSYKSSRQPPYRMIRQNYSDGVEQVSFTKADLLDSENELNFVVQGALGTSFKWEIFMEPIVVAPDLSNNITCDCGKEETIAIICEQFENMSEGSITNQSEYFKIDQNRNPQNATVVNGPDLGMNSTGALLLKDVPNLSTDRVNTEADLDLGGEKDGQYLLTWSMLIPENGTAEFTAPAFGGKYKFNGNGKGTLNLFDRYTLNLNYPVNKWIEMELAFEPARGLYRIRLADKIYYWFVRDGDNALDYLRFDGTDSGYTIDNICFERYIN